MQKTDNKRTDAYTFLKSFYNISTKRINLINTTWKFYDENSELVVFHNERGNLKTPGIRAKEYKINRWYISSPNYSNIKNIGHFIKQNKTCLLKMNKIVKNNIILKAQLDKILINSNVFKHANILGWRIDTHFYLCIDLYKSCLIDTIHIKTDNTFLHEYDCFVDYKTLLKILQTIDVKQYITNYIKNNTDKKINKENLQDQENLEETFSNIKITDECKHKNNNECDNKTKELQKSLNDNTYSENNTYDEIRTKYPNLFVNKPLRKRLEVQSCKNFWQFIDMD